MTALNGEYGIPAISQVAARQPQTVDLGATAATKAVFANVLPAAVSEWKEKEEPAYRLSLGSLAEEEAGNQRTPNVSWARVPVLGDETQQAACSCCPGGKHEAGRRCGCCPGGFHGGDTSWTADIPLEDSEPRCVRCAYWACAGGCPCDCHKKERARADLPTVEARGESRRRQDFLSLGPPLVTATFWYAGRNL